MDKIELRNLEKDKSAILIPSFEKSERILIESSENKKQLDKTKRENE